MSGLAQTDIADLEWLFTWAAADVSGLHGAPVEPALPRGREVPEATEVRLQVPRRRVAAAERQRRLHRVRDRLFAAPDGGDYWVVLRRLYGRLDERDRAAHPHWGRLAPIVRHTPSLRLAAYERARRAEVLRQLTVAHMAVERRWRIDGGSPLAALTPLLDLEELLVVQVDTDLAVDAFVRSLGRGHEGLVAAVRSEALELQRAAEEAYVEARRAVQPFRSRASAAADRFLGA